MNRLKQFAGSLLVVVALVLLYSHLPLGTAFAFSTDESYETMKPFLCNQGHVLYKDIWNDEPPMFTVILATAFKVFGTSILTARLVVVTLGIIWILVFYDLVRRRSGQATALIATFLLLSSPLVLLLSVAAILEMPTMATGLFAAWLLFNWKDRMHWAWLLFFGAIMGLAIQIKLTAVLLIPATAVEFTLLQTRRRGTSFWMKPPIKQLFIWASGIAMVCALVGLTLAKGSFEQSWRSHTGDLPVPGVERARDHIFKFQLLQNHVECVLGAAVGIALAISRKRGREIAFPVALLLTDTLVHAVHRPWFDYYYLHPAVPLAWLAGWAIYELVQDAIRFYGKNGFQFTSPAAWKQMVLCLLVAMVITRSELRLEWTIKDLRQHPSADSNPIVKKMKEFAGRVHLVYAEPGLYAFHAGLPVPPELAEVTAKRFWSGQITTTDVINSCRKDQVDLIVLQKARISDEWKSFLDADYINVESDDSSILFLSKNVK